MGNRVFLGCNYNDKSVKLAFDNLKLSLEKELPVEIIVIDKQEGRHAKDLWREIKQKIEESNLNVFDVTAFRPNVVLELGYALSVKEEKSVVITFRSRKSNGKSPDWLLSDISHLNRIQYKQIKELKGKIAREIENIKFMKQYRLIEKQYGAKTETAKHWEYLKKTIFEIRDEGTRSMQQIKSIIQGSNLRLENFIKLMRETKLIDKRGDRFNITEDK